MHPCCGQSLRRASFIVAILEIVLALIASVFYILGLTAAGDFRDHKELKEILQNFRIPFFNMEVEHTSEEIVATLRAIFGVALSFSLFDIGISAVLILAVKRKSNKLMKFWVGVRLLFLSIDLIYIFTVLITGYSTTGGFFADIASVTFRIYLLCVVRAYMLQIREELALKTSPSIIQTQGKIDVTFPL